MPHSGTGILALVRISYYEIRVQYDSCTVPAGEFSILLFVKLYESPERGLFKIPC